MAEQKDLVVAREHRAPGQPSYAELQGIIKRLTQQHVIDMEDLARERRVKATLAAQLDMVSGHRYGWPHQPFDADGAAKKDQSKPGGRPTTTTEKVQDT